ASPQGLRCPGRVRRWSSRPGRSDVVHQLAFLSMTKGGEPASFPPSMTRVVPVMKAASSEQRKTAEAGLPAARARPASRSPTGARPPSASHPTRGGGVGPQAAEDAAQRVDLRVGDPGPYAPVEGGHRL